MVNPVFGKGQVQVYTGDGKGKSTAALGLSLRAAGHGLKVIIVQFMKGDPEYGEITALKNVPFEIEVHQTGRPDFVSKDDPHELDVAEAKRGLDIARDVIEKKSADILILDELNVALDFGLVEIEDAIELIDSKPEGMELIITGRKAPKEIIERADLVTEMREVKHYFANGLMGRKGIEY
jgi:cob(I)alamin adenosyltransferase